jgi:CubicO group peptidase (beta-lactamase class C family)
MNYILYFIVGTITIFILSSFYKRISFSSNILTEKQNKVFTKLIEPFPNNTELSIAIIKNGEVRYLGVKIRDNQIFEVENQNKVFEIGSLTKVFTATLLADFVCDSLLKLSDPIQKLLSFEINSKENITLRALANHTSGLPRMPSNFDVENPNFNETWKEYGESMLIEYMKTELKLNSTPSKKWKYSNLGSGLLGYILEQVSETSYEDLLQKKILEKHQMYSTTTKLENIKSEIVKGQDKNGLPTPNWEFDVLVGAGGMFSTTNDLSKFAVAQFDKANQELLLTHIPTFTIDKKMKIGLGWYLLNKNTNLLWHNGGTSGYTSSIALDLESQNGIIILSNLSAFHKKMGNIDKICFELLEISNKKMLIK